MKRRFQTEIPLENLFLCTRYAYFKTLLLKSENFYAKSEKPEKHKRSKKILKFILRIGWVQLWGLCWKLRGKFLKLLSQNWKKIWINISSNFFSSEFSSGHVEGRVAIMSKVSCQKSQKFLLTMLKWWKKVFPQQQFCRKVPIDTYKAVRWPLFFFCHKPENQQLKVKKWRAIFFSFEFVFISIQISSGLLEGSFGKPAEKLCQTTKKFSTRVRKKRNWYIIRKTLFSNKILWTRGI